MPKKYFSTKDEKIHVQLRRSAGNPVANRADDESKTGKLQRVIVGSFWKGRTEEVRHYLIFRKAFIDVGYRSIIFVALDRRL